MRTFIAIELSDSIKDDLSKIQSHLKYAGADVKWVEKENIHLTLKFLGEISEEKAQEVMSLLDEVGSQTKAFEIEMKELGVFPKIDFPRVVWVGLEKGAGESKMLAERIDEGLALLGFEKESRHFTAHLTIGRVRSPKNKEALKEKIKTCQDPPPASQTISSVILFKSTLTPRGSIYTKLHEAKLAKSGLE